MYIINQRLRNTAYAQLCIDKRTQFEESARHSKYIAMLNSPDYPDVETGLRFDNFNMQDTEYSDLSFFCESAVDAHLPAVEEKPIFLTDGTLNVWYKAHRFPNLVFFFCTKPNGHANSGSVKEKLFGTKDIDVTVIEHPDWDLTKYFVVNVGEIDTTAPIENIPLVYRKPINEKALELILQNYGGLE